MKAACKFTIILIPGPVNNTLLPIFSSCPSDTSYSTHPPITTSYKYHPIPPHHQKTPYPCPPLTSRTNPAAARDTLGRPDIHSKDPEHVTHLQNMLVTPGCGPGIYGLDKDGMDWAFGSFTEMAVNDFKEKNRDRKELISHLGV